MLGRWFAMRCCLSVSLCGFTQLMLWINLTLSVKCELNVSWIKPKIHYTRFLVTSPQTWKLTTRW